VEDLTPRPLRVLAQETTELAELFEQWAKKLLSDLEFTDRCEWLARQLIQRERERCSPRKT